MMEDDSPQSASTSPTPTLARKGKLDNNDDWSGLTDQAERRRRQNRLNQRAYRKRKQAQQCELDVYRNKSKSKDAPSTAQELSPSTSITLYLNDQTTLTPQRNDRPHITINQVHELLEQITQTTYQSYMLGFPAADHLLTLSKVNVFRAFTSNMALLGISCVDASMDNAISRFLTMQPGNIEINLPPSLHPTQLQRTIPHHPWLDFLPHPKMRDNLLTAGEDNFDDGQLCMDIMGFWDKSDSCALLVWGEPSNPNNWELTESFLQKWPWVVRGCPDLMQSTNYWRRQRGEKMIFRYL